MNKAEAMKIACAGVADVIENHLQAVIGWAHSDGVSDADAQKIDDALDKITAEMRRRST